MGNRLASNGMGLRYTAPKVVDGMIEVIMEEKDVKSEMDFWADALILYEIGEDLTMNDVKGS